jgi:polyisoprenoid-binding protein YceI
MPNLKAIVLAGLALCLAAPASAANWTTTAGSVLGLKGTIYGTETTAEFKVFKTDIKFDPADLVESSVVVTVDMTSLYSGISESDKEVRDEGWFDVPKFPLARFATKSFRDLGNGKYQAIADLTIRGVTHEVVLPFALTIQGKQAHMTGKLTLSRLDYGIGQDFPDDTYVGRNVEVDVELTADRTS